MKSQDFEFRVGDSLKLNIHGKVMRASIYRITHTGDYVTSIVVKNLKGEVYYLNTQKFLESVVDSALAEVELIA